MSAFFAPMIIPFLLVLILGAALFPRFIRTLLTLIFFAVLLLIASFIDHASAKDLNTENHETLVRYAGYFSNCAYGNAYNHRDKIHELKMLGGNVTATLIMACQPVSNEYVHWCMTVGHDEQSCYGDLGLMAQDVLQQIGE
ncbi:hypothetical protein [Rhizobium sp. 11515TR]|uniref:hypothetical protein n=1 Tax=Rhizobium sp. 11515TR TaxID=2028343 RepID=UPI000BA8801D|nr:hypothetical protein [Rhizobium sp. 11515TR]ASW06310.1 hypothetical protein CKA34_10730 [Rhizobium sp. 11515TR]